MRAIRVRSATTASTTAASGNAGPIRRGRGPERVRHRSQCRLPSLLGVGDAQAARCMRPRAPSAVVALETSSHFRARRIAGERSVATHMPTIQSFTTLQTSNRSPTTPATHHRRCNSSHFSQIRSPNRRSSL